MDMTDSTPLVEKVAMAIAEYRYNPGYRWPDMTEFQHEFLRGEARAALDASGKDELVEALKDALAALDYFWAHIELDAEIGPQVAKARKRGRAAIAPTQELESRL